MDKFKVGDTVERILNAGDVHYFSRQVGPGPYVVTSVSPAGKWLGINGWVDNKGDKEPWRAINFTLLEQQDDPLPPAPESGVYYSHNNDRRVTVLLEEGLPEDVIAVGTDAPFMKVRLTAETALVLAHDLNRMANEIKRKEKQRG